MRRAGQIVGVGLLLATGASCTGTQASPDTGIAEPIRIQGGQFVPGALPGSADAGTDGGASPQVTDVNVSDTTVAQGELGLVFSGHTTTDAQAVGVRFADQGSGYWVVPVSAPDPTDQGLLSWQLSADFANGIKPGEHPLAFAAIGPDGASGSQSLLTVCLDTPVPDNLNVCAPKRAPPITVLSLSWDSPVDLDLIVLTPTGGVIGGKTASSAPAGADLSTSASTGGGVLDHDSNRGCAIDNLDREDAIWQKSPPSGTYEVWVDLFSACGKAAVSFNVSLWLAEAQPDGTERLVEQTPPIATGVLTAQQANGGSAPGLFVGDFVIQ